MYKKAQHISNSRWQLESETTHEFRDHPHDYAIWKESKWWMSMERRSIEEAVPNESPTLNNHKIREIGAEQKTVQLKVTKKERGHDQDAVDPMPVTMSVRTGTFHPSGY